MVVIHTKTEQEYNDTLNELHKQGNIWQNGKQLTDRSHYMIFEFPNIYLHIINNKVSISDRDETAI